MPQIGVVDKTYARNRVMLTKLMAVLGYVDKTYGSIRFC